jgi:hypothetical protein
VVGLPAGGLPCSHPLNSHSSASMDSRRLVLRCLPEGLSVEVIDMGPGKAPDTRVIVLNDNQVEKLSADPKVYTGARSSVMDCSPLHARTTAVLPLYRYGCEDLSTPADRE